MARKANLVKISDITKAADSLAKSIRARAKFSKQIRNAVKVEKGNTQGDVTSISVTVGANKTDKSGNPLAGMIGAFEYGSGIHGEGGERYAIVPRPGNDVGLVFRGTKKFSGQWIRTQLVMHPGVKARPFIRPAIEAVSKKLTDELAADIRNNIVTELSAVIRKINV